MSYDKNGNIIDLQRNGRIYADIQEIDNLIYNYDGNRLMKVTDSSNSPQGFNDGFNQAGVNDYSYDDNGNMIVDKNKDIQSIIYNHLNLPTQINFGNGNRINYLYNAVGQKVNKNVRTGNEYADTDYLGGFQYRSSYTAAQGDLHEPVLQYFPMAEGYIEHKEGRFFYIYHYTDHLGNIRLSYTYDENVGMIRIMEENHYYPFGLKHESYNTQRLGYTEFINEEEVREFILGEQPKFVGDGSYGYKYNGKELQDELGLNMYDYGARNYDPALGRWMNVDPLAETSRRWSPYNYVYNNPLRFIDPDGMRAMDPIFGKNFWGNVKLIGDDGKSDGKSYLVRGDVKKDVKAATKKGQDYTGALTEGVNVMKIPTGGIMDDVIDSVDDTISSGREQSGHAMEGDKRATRWDEGPEPTISIDEKTGEKSLTASFVMFKIGKSTRAPDVSKMEFWWHTHPNVAVEGITLGSSNPSEADYRCQSNVKNFGFKGNTFVIGVRTQTVTFYTIGNNGKNKSLMTVKYSDFLKMGGK